MISDLEHLTLTYERASSIVVSIATIFLNSHHGICGNHLWQNVQAKYMKIWRQKRCSKRQPKRTKCMILTIILKRYVIYEKEIGISANSKNVWMHISMIFIIILWHQTMQTTNMLSRDADDDTFIVLLHEVAIPVFSTSEQNKYI